MAADRPVVCRYHEFILIRGRYHCVGALWPRPSVPATPEFRARENGKIRSPFATARKPDETPDGKSAVEFSATIYRPSRPTVGPTAAPRQSSVASVSLSPRRRRQDVVTDIFVYVSARSGDVNGSLTTTQRLGNESKNPVVPDYTTYAYNFLFLTSLPTSRTVRSTSSSPSSLSRTHFGAVSKSPRVSVLENSSPHTP